MGISETFREIREERVNRSYISREPALPKANAITRAVARLGELTAELTRSREIASAACPTSPHAWPTEANISDSRRVSEAVAALPVHQCSGTCERTWHGRTVRAVRQALNTRVRNGGLDTCTGRVVVSLATELGIRPSDESLAAQALRVEEWHRDRVATATARLAALPAEIAAAQIDLDLAQAMPDDTDEQHEAHREWRSNHSAALDGEEWTDEDDDRLGDVIHVRR